MSKIPPLHAGPLDDLRGQCHDLLDHIPGMGLEDVRAALVNFVRYYRGDDYVPIRSSPLMCPVCPKCKSCNTMYMHGDPNCVCADCDNRWSN